MRASIVDIVFTNIIAFESGYLIDFIEIYIFASIVDFVFLTLLDYLGNGSCVISWDSQQALVRLCTRKRLLWIGFNTINSSIYVLVYAIYQYPWDCITICWLGNNTLHYRKPLNLAPWFWIFLHYQYDTDYHCEDWLLIFTIAIFGNKCSRRTKEVLSMEQ